jgi:hypothetical protein
MVSRSFVAFLACSFATVNPLCRVSRNSGQTSGLPISARRRYCSGEDNRQTAADVLVTHRRNVPRRIQ